MLAIFLNAFLEAIGAGLGTAVAAYVVEVMSRWLSRR